MLILKPVLAAIATDEGWCHNFLKLSRKHIKKIFFLRQDIALNRRCFLQHLFCRTFVKKSLSRNLVPSKGVYPGFPQT